MLEQATLSAGIHRKLHASIANYIGWVVMGMAAMVFSNALCLFLPGTALLLTTRQWRWRVEWVQAQWPHTQHNCAVYVPVPCKVLPCY